MHTCVHAYVQSYKQRERERKRNTMHDFYIPFLDILAYEKISEKENFSFLPVVRAKSGSARDMTPFILVISYRRKKRKLLQLSSECE